MAETEDGLVRGVESLVHGGELWHIVKINGSYFARCRDSDTGPYSTVRQAEDWIMAVKQ